MSDENQKIIDAINDLSRVVLACNDKIKSRSEAIRRLHLVAMSPSRIASLLSMAPKDVTSQISRNKKAKGGKNGRSRD